ncbi:MAG: peptidoglycan DD-metalloendopeptidase family protein [Fusobacterium sp. JB020]|nr:peptidoglycan DD-metalloendopeptidase family protein [Fusobacterium sp. JB020]
MKLILIYFLSSIFIFGSSNVNQMKEKIKKLDTEIKVKHERIEVIDNTKKTIEEQIEEIRKEINEILKDRNKIELEIKSIMKNIDYGERNLKFSSKELQRTKSEFDAKIIAWNRRDKSKLSFEEEGILKRQFSKILYNDLNRMTKIKDVTHDIKEVKANIEKEKTKLARLRYSLNLKKNQIAKKQYQKNKLIKKLEKEKKSHISKISSLEKQKKRIEKEIENIINSRIKSVGKVKYSTAISKLGRAAYPLTNGRIILNFNDFKAKSVSSNGIEMRGKLGDIVRSSFKGEIIYSGKIQGLGKVVMIDYGYNTIGVYGNLISSKVKQNQRVIQGQKIGILGYSIDKKPNLYYEIRMNLKPIDPRKFLK